MFMCLTLTLYTRFDTTSLSEDTSTLTTITTYPILPASLDGTIKPGISESTEEGERVRIWQILKLADYEQDDPMQGDDGPEDQQEVDEEEEAVEAEEELVKCMASILIISQDQR